MKGGDDERLGVKGGFSRVIYCNSRKTEVCPAEVCRYASSKERSRDDREDVEEDGESRCFSPRSRVARLG